MKVHCSYRQSCFQNSPREETVWEGRRRWKVSTKIKDGEKKRGNKIWVSLNMINLRPNDRLLWKWQWTFLSHKRPRISCLPEELSTFQEGTSIKGLFSWSNWNHYHICYFCLMQKPRNCRWCEWKCFRPQCCVVVPAVVIIQFLLRFQCCYYS
jgi:hypothetical protein